MSEYTIDVWNVIVCVHEGKVDDSSFYKKKLDAILSTKRYLEAGCDQVTIEHWKAVVEDDPNYDRSDDWLDLYPAWDAPEE